MGCRQRAVIGAYDPPTTGKLAIWKLTDCLEGRLGAIKAGKKAGEMISWQLGASALDVSVKIPWVLARLRLGFPSFQSHQKSELLVLDMGWQNHPAHNFLVWLCHAHNLT